MIHVLTIVCALLIGSATELVDSPVQSSSVAVVALADEDRPMGTVNLCDPTGEKCVAPKEAFVDKNNGRVYVMINGNKYYAQSSNDERWPYMIRYQDRWFYFNL